MLNLFRPFGSKYPDDDNFRVYKVWKKNKQTSYLAKYVPNCECNLMHFYLEKLVCQGAESYRSGTQTKASGLVKGKTAKKVLGSMLDAHIAHMGTPGGSSTGGAKGRGKGGKGKAAANKTTKTTSPQDKEKKELQKDINAFPGKNNVVWNQFINSSGCLAGSWIVCPWPRLRDKGSKAQEVALDLNELKIPHQEVPSQDTIDPMSLQFAAIRCMHHQYPDVITQPEMRHHRPWSRS